MKTMKNEMNFNLRNIFCHVYNKHFDKYVSMYIHSKLNYYYYLNSITSFKTKIIYKNIYLRIKIK